MFVSFRLNSFFFFASFVVSIFGRFLDRFWYYLGGFGGSKSVIFGIDFLMIFACRSKSGPRAAKSGPNAHACACARVHVHVRVHVRVHAREKSPQNPPKTPPKSTQERQKVTQEGPRKQTSIVFDDF